MLAIFYMFKNLLKKLCSIKPIEFNEINPLSYTDIDNNFISFNILRDSSYVLSSDNTITTSHNNFGYYQNEIRIVNMFLNELTLPIYHGNITILETTINKINIENISGLLHLHKTYIKEITIPKSITFVLLDHNTIITNLKEIKNTCTITYTNIKNK